jgi:hypothetical protein
VGTCWWRLRDSFHPNLPELEKNKKTPSAAAANLRMQTKLFFFLPS